MAVVVVFLAAAVCRAENGDLLGEVEVPNGFEIAVLATPEQANYPVFVAATVGGTVFVSSDGNGSLGRDPGRGRILRLRDTDGNGTADEVKVFVGGLDSPRGLLWVDESLVVLHPPDITRFRDTDDDGVADDRTTLVRGIAFDYSQRPADHTSNGLTLGIDGWVYAAVGDFGFMEAVGNDGRRLQFRGGGIVRFRPDGSGLDLFARGTRNIFEAVVGPRLEMIARDNTNDGGGWNVRLHALTGFEDHGYPRRYVRFADEVVPPLADYGGGSGTGGCWIDEPWMPAPLNDSAFTCDWGRGRIFRHPVAVHGAGYTATQEQFLVSPRVTDLDVDALGHVYVASWRNGHYKWTGPDVGFIARLTPKGLTPQTVPDVARAKAEELAAILAGPSHRLRIEAQRALLSRGLVEQAAGPLEQLAGDGSARLASRVAAVFTLALGRKADAVPMLTKLSADPTIAAWATRAMGDLAAAGVALPDGTVTAALAAADARARNEAVIATVRIAAPAAASRIVPLTADADPLVAHTAIEGLVRLAAVREADVLAACIRAVDDPSTPPVVHRAAVRVLGEIHSEAAAAAVISRLDTATDASRRADFAWAAARLWKREASWNGESWGARPDTRGPYYAMETWAASSGLRGALIEAVEREPLPGLPALVHTLGLHRLPATDVVPVLLGRDGARAALVAFLEVAGESVPPEALPALADAAADPAAPLAARLAAIRALGWSSEPEAVRMLCDAVIAIETSRASPADVAAARKVARDAAGRLPDLSPLDAVVVKGPLHAALADDMLLTMAGSGGTSMDARRAAIARLAADWKASPERRAALVAASVRTRSKVLAKNLVAAADQDVDAGIRAAANAALSSLRIDAKKFRQITADKGPKVGEQDVGKVLDRVNKQRGDRTIGAELFVSRKCVSCHAAAVDSAGLGPSLANAAGIYNRRQLAEAILQPNKSIAQGFETTHLLLDDGRQVVGFVTSEGADALTLRDGQGAEHRVAKEAIDDRQKLPTSVMPEGLVADLSVGEFASLLDFIQSIGK